MMATERPRVVPTRSRLEKGLEILSACAVLASLGITIGFWDTLPDTVPRHFGPGGVPDAYGSKGNVAAPALLSLGLYVLLSAVSLIPPRRYNYPLKVTEENAAAQYRLARKAVAWLKLGFTGGLVWGTWLTVQTALGNRAGLGPLFLPGLVVVGGLPLVVYAIVAYRSR